MRHQSERRDSKSIIVVDEDIPPSIVESYRAAYDNGPLAHSDPRSLLLSMSEYNKPQDYNVYDYTSATRSEPGQDYSGFGVQQTYPSQYVATQAQVPSGLPQSTGLPMVPPAQQYSGPPDPTYYSTYAAQPAYLDSAPRQPPEIISYMPQGGLQGTRITVYFRSIYDFESPPIRVFLVFGSYKAQSTLIKTAQQNQMYQYSLTAETPPLSMTNSPSPQTPLHLFLDDSLWSTPTVDVGFFTYNDPPAYLPAQSPQVAPKKRKLSPQASPRRSPVKKQSFQQLPGPSRPPTYTYTGPPSTNYPSSPSTRRPSLPDYQQTRRFSGPEYQQSYSATPLTTQQYYGVQPSGQATPGLSTAHSPSWSYHQSTQPAVRSPSGAPLSTVSRTASNLMPSPAQPGNPPLIRTSTLQQSPTTPNTVISPPGFNPYAIYPANTKALLKIDGELNTMVENWSPAEWEVQRRLVQWTRSQSGSVITATFQAVTPETRAPNSICVSCIWWEEKQECYVTSVDTIQLLESLVAVRFTVEEKNRIRRNLEGFRPATVSKAKPDSEDFFKLIMGFPSPKPRNIEKDVKSASYSSTAGALHAPAGPSYTAGRGSDTGVEQHAQQRPAASPRSTSSSATSHGHAYAPTHNLTTHAYSPHASAGLGIGPSAGPPDLRLAVPVSAASQTTSWHQPSAQYSDLSAAQHNRTSWDFNYGIGSSPATGLPGSAQSYQYQYGQTRLPSFTTGAAMPTGDRFVPLQDYEPDQSHQTTTS